MIVENIEKIGVIDFEDKLTIKSGNTIAVIGKNGKGKTTFLRVLSGNVLPDKGKINIDYKSYIYPINLIERSKYQKIFRDRILYFEGQGYLYNNLTVRQNIKYYSLISDFNEELLLELLYNLNFESKDMNKQVKDISLGTKQKITIGLAFASSRKIILIDEPTLGLDIESKQSFIKILEQFKQEKSIIISSNDETILDYFDLYVYCDDNEVKKIYENPYNKS